VIFVTVGAQMPFDRLVGAVDTWAGTNNRRDIFAQTGETERTFDSLECAPLLQPHAARCVPSRGQRNRVGRRVARR